MIQNMDIARAYLIEANNDYDARQAVEKLLKACLAAEGEIGIYKHEIFSFFLHAFKDKIEIETMALLEEAVVPLEENWAMSKYPDWRVNPIWIPSRRYNHDNARMNETRMQSVFEILVPFLKINYDIEV